MLASTMQFSSNDQSPAHNTTALKTEPAVEGTTIVPSGPNNVPDQTSHQRFPHPKAVLTPATNSTE
jgi:hypothetical protein